MCIYSHIWGEQIINKLSSEKNNNCKYQKKTESIGLGVWIKMLYYLMY